MYSKRIKIFVALTALILSVCILTLMKMQLFSGSYYLEKIAELKAQRGYSKQLKTVRGKILDRNGKTLAADDPLFQVKINYQLTRYLDPNVQLAMFAAAEQKLDATVAIEEAKEKIDSHTEDLNYIIEKCVKLRHSRQSIEERIKRINNKIWNQRTFQAWSRNHRNEEIVKKYNSLGSVPLSVAIKDFKEKVPNQKQRLIAIAKINDIPEMYSDEPLVELYTDDDIFTAQIEFMDTPHITILAKAKRLYPYNSVAPHTIGWVGPARGSDTSVFEDDKLLKYIDSDVYGREDGTEYVCEAILRGRRGELVFDIDRQLQKRTETEFGQDVTLTLDIDLQQRIESLILSPLTNPNAEKPSAAVVIEANSGEILALVSTPLYDLNRIRYDYSKLEADPHKPLINRAINVQYPPGSIVKPLLLAAALEEKIITPLETISCPAHNAPTGWPNCWIIKRWSCHDDRWTANGGNIARNAIRGSCNIYFSRLAVKFKPQILQQWLFNFGYGRNILPPPFAINDTPLKRNHRQLHGSISQKQLSTRIEVTDYNQVPMLDDREPRWFGIGQGNLRVTPLHVANSMAMLARGAYKPPKLYIEEQNHDPNYNAPIRISDETLSVVYDGMRAVINEPGGTAYEEFRNSGLDEKEIDIYGKTGSTENPDNAWFAGFAKDSDSRSIAISVIVEGGQHGSSDAAPLGREIMKICNELGYIGK